MARRRTYLLRITLTPEEEREAKAAAEALGVSLASLGRMAIFNAIRAVKTDGKKKSVPPR